MKTDEELKNIVKEKYGKIAIAIIHAGGCCGTKNEVTIDYNIMSDDYLKIEGYVPDADLGLGCGLPTEYAGIKSGNKVLDLGSGAGNDVFIARRIVGKEGKVIGVDFTDEMINKARINSEKLGYNNVEFRKGDIEDLPVTDESVDVVISNCVLNLVPDKKKAFSEIFRVIKSGGHLCVSDIVLKGKLHDRLRDAAAIYTGCVAGALQIEDYLENVGNAGFKDIVVVKKKNINIPDNLLLEYISQAELDEFKDSGCRILSITVTANK